MGKTQLENSEATNRYTRSNTKCSSLQTIEKANEHLGWLPDGWNVDFRTRKGGTRMGYGYKCYIDPNGNKFYSKPEVLRYLETINGSSCTSKMEERCISMPSPNKDAVEKSAVEDVSPGLMTEGKNRKSSNHIGKNMDAVEKSTVKDIPPGWITEVTIRKGGKGNKKDVLYTDPVSGYGFHSKKDVLRYLESGDISTCKIKPIKRQIDVEDRSTPSSVGKKKKLEQSSTKGQLFVGKEISDESILELQDVNSSQKGQDVKVDSGIMVTPVPTSGSVVNTQSLQSSGSHCPEINITSDPDDIQKKNHVVHMTEIASKKTRSNCNVSKSKEFNVGLRVSPRLAGVESDQLANSFTKELSLQLPKGNLRKPSVALNTNLANDSTQQLNGVQKIDHSDEMKEEVVLNKGSMLSGCHALFKAQQCQLETDKIKYSESEKNHYSLSRDSSLPSLKVAAVKVIRTELPSPDNPPSSHGLDPEASHSKENRLCASQTRKSGLQEIQSNSNQSSNKKDHQIPHQASKRLAGPEPEMMSDSVSYSNSLEYKSKRSKGEVNADLKQSKSLQPMVLTDHSSIYGKPSNNCGKTSEVAHLVNDQLGKHEDEEIYDEKSELQQSFTFHYSCYDPCVEFAIKTVTSVLPVEDLVGNGRTQIPKTDIQKQPSLCQIPETDMLPKNKLFENGRGNSSDKKLSALPVDYSIGNRPTQIPDIDMLHKNKVFENVTGSSNDKSPRVSSKKSKNKKEIIIPRRLSKRLAGNEPEVMPAERALEYATRKLCKDKPTTTAILTQGVSAHIHDEEESKLIVHASDMLETRVCGEPSNKSDKACAQIASNQQLQRPGAENIYDGKSEPQFPLPFGDSWSDSCLEFAIETLTCGLPDDDAADIFPFMIPDINEPANMEFPESEVHKIRTVMIPDINDPPNKEVLQKGIYEETHDKSNQLQIKPVMILDINDSPNKEFPECVVQKSVNEDADDNSNKPRIKAVLVPDINVVSQSSEQPLDQPELRSSTTSCENYHKFATRESYSDDGNITKKFYEGESLCCKAEAGKVTRIDINTIILEEPLKVNEPVLQGGSVAGQQQPETEPIKYDHSGGEVCLPFMDSWSDPCLEFAFKTLTGVVPVDDDIAIHRCFQECADPHDQRNGITMFPEFGSSSTTRSDISFYTDIEDDKSMPGQQPSIKGQPRSHR